MTTQIMPTHFAPAFFPVQGLNIYTHSLPLGGVTTPEDHYSHQSFELPPKTQPAARWALGASPAFAQMGPIHPADQAYAILEEKVNELIQALSTVAASPALLIASALALVGIGYFGVRSIQRRSPPEQAPVAPLPKPVSEILIGRGLNVGLRLNDDTLDYGHARIFKADDGHFYLEDLASQNGSYLFGNANRYERIPAHQPHRLYKNHVIAFSKNSKMSVTFNQHGDLVLSPVSENKKDGERWIHGNPHTLKWTRLLSTDEIIQASQLEKKQKIDNALIEAEAQRYVFETDNQDQRILNEVWGHHNDFSANFTAKGKTIFGSIRTSSANYRKQSPTDDPEHVNQDTIAVAPDGNGVILFDGMGGHSGGANASRIATNDFWASMAARPEDSIEDYFERVIVGMYDLWQSNPTKMNESSGAVGVAYRVKTQGTKKYLDYGFIGDAGLRVFRKNKSTHKYEEVLRTFEHNLALQLLIKDNNGVYDPTLMAQYHTHPQSNVVKRSITANASDILYEAKQEGESRPLEYTPEYGQFELQTGDLIVAYGDGIGDNLVDEDYLDLINAVQDDKGDVDPEKLNNLIFEKARSPQRSNGTDSKDDDVSVSVSRVI